MPTTTTVTVEAAVLRDLCGQIVDTTIMIETARRSAQSPQMDHLIECLETTLYAETCMLAKVLGQKIGGRDLRDEARRALTVWEGRYDRITYLFHFVQTRLATA